MAHPDPDQRIDSPPREVVMADTVEAPPGMLHVPAGPFLFGRKNEEVDLGEFWIDGFPITNRQYGQFVEEHNRPSPRYCSLSSPARRWWRSRLPPRNASADACGTTSRSSLTSPSVRPSVRAAGRSSSSGSVDAY